jgi:hypothetical protein
MTKSIETVQRLLSLPPVWRHRLSILAITLASLLAVYTLAGFFLAPYLITRYAPQYAAEQLHVQLRLERVRINPLLFTCEIEKLSLQTDGEPMLSVQRLFADFELESVFRRAWTFADLAIDKPALHLIIGKDNRLNLAKFIEQLPQSPEPPKNGNTAPPRLLLKHLALSEGTAQLTDQSTPRPSEAGLCAAGAAVGATVSWDIAWGASSSGESPGTRRRPLLETENCVCALASWREADLVGSVSCSTSSSSAS